MMWRERKYMGRAVAVDVGCECRLLRLMTPDSLPRKSSASSKEVL